MRLRVLNRSDLALSAKTSVLGLRFHGEGEKSGIPLEQATGCIVQVRDGKIRRWRTFMSYEQALEAAGLRP